MNSAPFVARCLNLAQFVPTFVWPINPLVLFDLGLWAFRGDTVARLHQLLDKKKAAPKDGPTYSGLSQLRPKGAG